MYPFSIFISYRYEFYLQISVGTNVFDIPNKDIYQTIKKYNTKGDRP